MSEELGEVDRQASGGRVEFLRGGALFAVSDTQAVELRLRPDVADAARRTPDTTASDRGDDWVHFAPPDWNDPLARDRLTAWFRLAWRAVATVR
jgi:hypothetical protein